MKPFDYIVPTTLVEATDILARYGAAARVIAGGTDVLVELRRDSENAPEVIVDISRVQGLRGVDLKQGMLAIKPLTTHAEIGASDLVRKLAPLLAVAASMIGSPQIRNRGTIGGNIMNAAACADTVPPLLALGTVLTLSSASGTRQCRLEEFFVKPYKTIARPDEVLTDIQCAVLPMEARSTFLKLGRRNAVAIARLSVAAILSRDGSGVITDARIVPGAAFPTWKRVKEAERILTGHQPSQILFAEAGIKVSECMIAATGRRWSTEYKEPVIPVLVRRALETCASQQ